MHNVNVCWCVIRLWCPAVAAAALLTSSVWWRVGWVASVSCWGQRRASFGRESWRPSCPTPSPSHKTSCPWLTATASAGKTHDPSGGGGVIWPKSYITIWQILYHDIVIFFSFKKVFIILKSLIPYHFHNRCHRCQYQTNTSLKRETQPHWR